MMDDYEYDYEDSGDPRDAELSIAARNGDWSKISWLLSEWQDNDRVVTHDGRLHRQVTALSLVSRHGQYECVQNLLNLGVSKFGPGEDIADYKCALELAAIWGHFECFKLLVENRLFETSNDKQKYGDFIDGSKKGNFDQIIEKLLDECLDRNILNGWKGNNLMSLFLVYGCPSSCLQTLIDLGVDIKGFDCNGFTPLMCAVLAGNVECVHFLLCLGVDINTVTVDDTGYFLENGMYNRSVLREEEDWGRQNTALLYAACVRNAECLKEILHFFPNVVNEYLNYNNWTALYFAVYFRNSNSVSLLLKSGALLELPVDYDGLTPLYYANLFRDADCLQLLLEVASPDIKMTTLDHRLCYDMNNEFYQIGLDVNCLFILLDHINDLNAPIRCWTLLEAASKNSNGDSVRLLLDRGADINNKNSISGKTALMHSCDDKCERMLDLLIQSGADVNIQDEDGWTAIMYAAKNNALICVVKLLAHGASAHVRNGNGETALMLACANDHAEFVDVLIKSGVDVEVRNHDGHTAIGYVRTMKCLRLLMDKEADIHSKDEEGKTALIFSCEKGFVDITDVLIKHGVDINAQDGYGKTAAMYATDNKNEECLKLLLAGDVNLDLVDIWGYTVFCYAMRRDGNCLELLLNNGKLLCDGVLRSEHKYGMQKLNKIDHFHPKCLSLTMNSGLFDWNWCCLSKFIDTISTSAVQCGISPGKIEYKDAEISLLLLAFIKCDYFSLYYLIANRYFLPEDYRVLSTDNTIKDIMRDNFLEYPLISYKDITGNESPNNIQVSFWIFEKLTSETLSLQTWSFLTISKALSLPNPDQRGRTNMVDSLPLPEKMKKNLKFKADMSKICRLQWQRTRLKKLINLLNFREEIVLTRNVTWCRKSCLYCYGSGLRCSDVQFGI